MRDKLHNWAFREELKKSRYDCWALSCLLWRKLPDKPKPSFSFKDDVVSVTRYWGIRVKASLTAVRKDDGMGKTLSFQRDWRDLQVPLHVQPLVALGSGSLVISPVADEGFDFSGLSGRLQSLPDGEVIENALVNFFNWAAEKLSEGTCLDGFCGDVRIGRFKVADHIVYRHDDEEREIWVNRDTDEVWEKTPEIGVVQARPNAWRTLGMFLLPYLGCASLFWWLAVQKNLTTPPPIMPEIRFSLYCVFVFLCVGVLLHGWAAKFAVAAGVFVCGKILIPWLGEAWDMTSELALLSPFVSGELAEAPVGAVYIASSLMLTLMAVAAAPSFALKVVGGYWGRAIGGIVLALAVSPWPISVVTMPEISTLPIKVGVVLFVLLCLFVIGDCGLTIVKTPKKDAGADDILVKIARISRPSFVFFYVGTVIMAVLLYNQFSILLW